MKKLLISFLLLTAIIGCVSTRVTMLDKSTKYESVAPNDVKVFLTENEIKGDYKVIALIKAEGDADFTDEKDMVDAIIKKAAEIGANGIIIGKLENPSLLESVAAYATETEYLLSRNGQAVAVRVTE